jgi:cell wall-associated NlpC family hydrolase
LVRGECWISAVVYQLQALRFRGKRRRFGHWSHVALVTSEHGRIVEVLPSGVVARNVAKYRLCEYHYVHIDAPDAARSDAVAFAESCVGQPYSVGALLGLGVALLTGGKVSVAERGQQSCAALVARALARETRASFPRAPADMTPADIAEYYGITP